MARATMTRKGQITIPVSIRRRLRLNPGDQIEFIGDDQDEIRVRPASTDVRDLKGIAHHGGKRPVSLEEMKKIIRKRAGNR